MDRHFSFLGTKRRLTELLVSESGAVDVQKAMGVGAVVTGSVLAAMLLAPTQANAGNCGYTDCNLAQKCCSAWNGQNWSYWCCDALRICGPEGGQCTWP